MVVNPNYIVAYRIACDPVHILRVRHARQIHPKHPTTRSVHAELSQEEVRTMLVKMRVFDEDQQVTIHYQTAINASALIQVAKPREATMLEKGKQFTQGAVPFFGEEFIKAVQADNKPEIEKSAMQAAMAVWLSDHLFAGVSEAEFVRCDLEFNMHPTGMVVYNRKPAQ